MQKRHAAHLRHWTPIGAVISLLVILFALTTVWVVWAQTPAPTGTVVATVDVRLRAGPGETFPSVAALSQGTLVLPFGRNADSTWVAVRARGTLGWIRVDLVSWSSDPAALPLIESLLPTQTAPPAFILPTTTPEGNWVNVGTEGAFVRGGPGVIYEPLGVVESGELVEAVGRNAELDWVLIRFEGGFGWIARSLVRWSVPLRSLPVLIPGNLTPSATFTATASATPSLTASATFTATPSPTATATLTATATFTSTATWTPTLTATATFTSTATSTATFTSTATQTSTLTATATATPTVQPSQTPTETATLTLSPLPSATFSATPSATISPTVTVPSTETPTATVTVTESVVLVVPTISSTPMPSSTFTPMPSPTATLTNTAAPLPSATTEMPTSAAVVAVLPSATALDATSTPEAPLVPEASADSQVGAGVELWVGIGGVAVLLAYAAFYWRGLTLLDRYRSGFVIDRCPVCQQGDLIVETRRDRIIGIPRPRRTVRCTHCRSLLRESGTRRWRYAVDPLDNPGLYKSLNGRILDEDELRALASRAAQTPSSVPVPRTAPKPPQFVEGDEE